jgi:hypothetical protein
MWDSSLSPEECAAELAYIRFDPLWKFGEECSEEVMRKVRWAVNVISNAQEKRLSHDKCDTCTNDCRILKWMVSEYKMTPTIFGGPGYKCRYHLCICRTECDYPDEYCRNCGCYTCVRCGSGCECIDDS